ncbi:hypothetical protein NBRC111893_2059 [Lentilactobacillus kosonis]|uniref:Uncharacterized protein n=1 Tax=Lentilactobacillus kosonis TaxID=2810561 RepID=A0A401FNI8_9LACO|nr:hypothetical protein NBRC111893_2059 [Lentilactobacillus kosonis]
MTVADELDLDLPGTRISEQLYAKMIQDPDWANLGTQGLIKLYESESQE